MRTRRGFFKDRTGATAIEYGLIAALMAVALIAGFGALSNGVSNTMTFIAGKVDG
jgi:pilus assembly protein Flp/PilA